MWRGLHAAHGDIVVWCDADITNFGPRFVVGLVGPLLTEPSVGFVKGFYDRPVKGEPGTGGRTTELVARPLISLLFPRLACIVQPLAGEYAGNRELLEAVPFVQGYGVDLGLLVDISAEFGTEAIAQVDLGTRVHRNRTLDELSPQALAIMQTAFVKAGIPLNSAMAATLVRPGREPVPMAHVERPPLASLRLQNRSA
jgi:glucosyl-3-phosphoglycerate synthase